MLNKATMIVSGRETKYIELIWVPILLQDSHYLLLSFNFKEVVIKVIDNFIGGQTTIEKYGHTIDFIKRWILHWLDIRRLHSKKKKLKTFKPHVVDVPWVDNTSKMAFGIFTMRNMKVYMGASLQGCEKQMTTKNSKVAVKFMRVKYLHTLIMWEKDEFRYVGRGNGWV